MVNIISRLKALEKGSARGELVIVVGVDEGTTDEQVGGCLKENGINAQPRDLLILVRRRFCRGTSQESRDAPTFMYAKPVGR